MSAKPIHLFRFTLLLILLLFASACAGQGATTAPATDEPTTPPTEDPNAAVVATPVVEPTESPTEAPTEAPTPLPVEPTAVPADPAELKLNGFAMQYPCTKTEPCVFGDASFSDGDVLAIWDPTLNALVEKRLDSLGRVLHVFGSLDSFGFYFLDFESQELREINAGEVANRYKLPGMYDLKGVPGMARFAVTILPGASGGESLSEIQMVPGMGHVARARDLAELVLPMQVAQGDDFDLDVWYTFEPYGIGGDIMYPVWHGLFVTDGMTTKELLPETLTFSGMSQDAALIAFTQIPRGEMSIRAAAGGPDTRFALLPDSDRGAGFAVFSPDGSKLAWIEASGSLAYENLKVTLRVAPVDGSEPLNWTAAQLSQYAGRDVLFVRPVGWLDAQRLLVQIEPTAKGEVPLILVVDLASSAAPRVLPGHFIGLLWGR